MISFREDSNSNTSMFHKFAKLLIESKVMFYFNILKTLFSKFFWNIFL